MKALMVQGTSSWAGKSVLATALCRHFARLGVAVAPFKAQNMSNNARVVDDGEIGTAQYLQALAARVRPQVRMNPVLIKPERGARSQVVLNGSVDRELSDRPWQERSDRIWPAAAGALESLLADYELVVMEGAGSPAEINLSRMDMSNLRAARAADAPVLIVSDIDRGGAFAHLYGTWSLLEGGDQARVAGFVLNKFRGDVDLLAPAPQRLEVLTGTPVVGVVPWLHHDLPDEDGVSTPRGIPGANRPLVVVVAYPTASNLDEFKSLEQVAELRYAHRPDDLARADLVILPGSKHVVADLRWMRAFGLDHAVIARARAGGRLIGICGGLQMLGGAIDQEAGAGGGGETGLALLPVATESAPRKLTCRTTTRFAGVLGEQWAELGGLEFSGYEIRYGRTRATAAASEALPDGRGWVDGPVLGINVHGLFECPEAVEAVIGAAPKRGIDQAIDALTDEVTAALDLARIEALAGVHA